MQADPYEGLNIALVICWIVQCWNKMNSRTISRCFAKCGFRHENDPKCHVDNPEPLCQNEIYLQTKEDHTVFPPFERSEVLMQQAIEEASKHENKCGEDVVSETKDEDLEVQAPPVASSAAVTKATEQIMVYDMARRDMEAFGSNFDLEKYLEIVKARRKLELKDSLITDYFTPKTTVPEDTLDG